MSTRAPDPRALITPDNFGVAPELLGLPLARPARRLGAMLIDLLLVGILIQAGGVFFGVLAALALWRISTPGANAGLLRRGVRSALRLTAALVLFVTITSIWGNIGGGDDDDSDGAGGSAFATIDLEGLDIAVDFRDATMIRTLAQLHEASDSATAAPHAATLAEWIDRKTAGDAEHRDRVARALLSDLNGEGALAAARAAFPSLARDPALAEVDAAGADTTAAEDDARIAALRTEADEQRRRAQALETQVEALDEQNRALREEIEDDDGGGGLMRWFLGALDDLGLGFGWGALYFTTVLTLMRGQTPGKRLMGVRVIRLDGGPITWWVAFERFGGYAASITTGMLGFAQILWDRNRQALHDKAIETVVIRVLPGVDYIAGKSTVRATRVGGVRAG